MSLGSIVFVVVGLLVAVLLVLWLRDRVVSRRPAAVPPPAGSARMMPQPSALTAGDIAWGVCGGLWLFMVTVGVVGGLVVAAALAILGSRH